MSVEAALWLLANLGYIQNLSDLKNQFIYIYGVTLAKN